MDAAWRGVEGSHLRTAGATLAAGAFTSHPPQPIPRAATTRATSFKSFAHSFATNVVSVPEHTQRENALCTTQDDAAIVTNKLLYIEAGARCIWPSLSRGLTLTAEASTSHEPQPSPQPFALPVHALDPSGNVIVVRNVDPHQLMGDNFSQSRRVP